jgi:nucleoside 2-deoxyribosyltransferase
LIRVNEPFFGNEHFSFIDLKLEIWEAAREIGYLVNKKIPTELYFKKTSSWAPVLERICAELESKQDESINNIKRIIYEFETRQLQGGIEEGKK